MTPRWKDKLGRVVKVSAEDRTLLVVEGVEGRWFRATVEQFVGPLEPVEERCRVRTDFGNYYCGAPDRYGNDSRISPSWTSHASSASTWPRARAEEVAKACRDLGWEAVVEVVE